MHDGTVGLGEAEIARSIPLLNGAILIYQQLLHIDHIGSQCVEATI